MSRIMNNVGLRPGQKSVVEAAAESQVKYELAQKKNQASPVYHTEATIAPDSNSAGAKGAEDLKASVPWQFCVEPNPAIKEILASYGIDNSKGPSEV